MGGLILLDPPPSEGYVLATGISSWSLRTMPTDTPRARTFLYPGVDLRAANGLFASTDIGVGWNASTRDDVQVGLRLSPWPGIVTSRVPYEHVGTRWEQGLFFNKALGSVAVFQSSVRHGGGRDADGWISESGVTSGVPLPGGELLGVSVGAGWANRRYRSSYVGDGRPVGEGWHDLQVALSYEHRITPQWRFDGQWLTARTAGPPDVAGSRHANMRSLSLAVWRDWR